MTEANSHSVFIFGFASSCKITRQRTWSVANSHIGGPVAWVVTGEIFPLKVRAKALSMTTATNWLLNFIIAFITPYIVDEEHGNLGSRVFFIWASAILIAIGFVWAFIYETKGMFIFETDVVGKLTPHQDLVWSRLMSCTVSLTRHGRAKTSARQSVSGRLKQQATTTPTFDK